MVLFNTTLLSNTREHDKLSISSNKIKLCVYLSKSLFHTTLYVQGPSSSKNVTPGKVD